MRRKMRRLIDADAAKEALTGWETEPTDEEIEYTIDHIPTVDAVPKGLFDQIKWERDIAIGRLQEIGCELGQKMNDVKTVMHGHVCTTIDRWSTMHQKCSECGEELEWKAYPNFCPNCGCRMDGVEE